MNLRPYRQPSRQRARQRQIGQKANAADKIIGKPVEDHRGYRADRGERGDNRGDDWPSTCRCPKDRPHGQLSRRNGFRRVWPPWMRSADTRFALADGLILWGPSPFYGVDLTPLRSKWGDWLLAGSILRLWLAAAKVVRSLHGVAGRALGRRAETRAEESAARKDEKVKAAAKAEALERIKVRCSSLSEGDSYVIAFCLLNNQ